MFIKPMLQPRKKLTHNTHADVTDGTVSEGVALLSHVHLGLEMFCWCGEAH